MAWRPSRNHTHVSADAVCAVCLFPSRPTGTERTNPAPDIPIRLRGERAETPTAVRAHDRPDLDADTHRDACADHIMVNLAGHCMGSATYR